MVTGGDHMEKILGILRFALAREVEGMEFYKEKLARVKTPEAREVLENLAKMEGEHVEFIGRLIAKLESDEEVSIETNLARSDFFTSKERSEIVGGNIDELAGDLSILRMAYLIEEDFEKFYRTSSRKVEDEEMRRVLAMLADWEEGHKKLLLAVYEDAMRGFWQRQGFEPLY